MNAVAVVTNSSAEIGQTAPRGGRWLRRGTLAFAAVAAVIVIAGCKKEPPPAPPAPAPPPPPAPTTIKLEDLAQEMRVDARVQFTPEMEIEESQSDLARAVISMADAVAKGNADTLRPMLTRNAQALLDDLQDKGEWEDATGKIEAVRVVYLGPAPAILNMASIASNMDQMQDMMATMMPKIMALGAAMEQVLAGIPPEAQEAIRAKAQEIQAVGQGVKPGTSPEQMTSQAREAMDVMIRELEAAGAAPDAVANLRSTFEEFIKAMPAMPEAVADGGGSGGASTAVILAIQDPAGSYLLGWTADQAFDKWVFTNAPTSRDVRARASAWDGIGEAGFGEMVAAMPPPLMDDPSGSSSPGNSPSSGGSSGSSPSDSQSPNRKNTPAGPITIPGG